mgnify:FL=1
MPGTETKIWMALKSRIATIPGGLAIAYPADVYTPTDAAYIAVGRVNIAPERVFVASGAHERRGTLTLSHVAPIGQDQAVYEEAGAKIAAHFPDDLCMNFQGVAVKIVSASHVVDGYRDGAWWRTPVNVFWRCAA